MLRRLILCVGTLLCLLTGASLAAVKTIYLKVDVTGFRTGAEPEDYPSYSLVSQTFQGTEYDDLYLYDRYSNPVLWSHCTEPDAPNPELMWLEGRIVDIVTDPSDSPPDQVAVCPRGNVTFLDWYYKAVEIEVPSEISVADAIPVPEGLAGTYTDVTFAISKDYRDSVAVRVKYQTVAGSAERNKDFIPVSGQVEFPANSLATQFVSVKVKGDLIEENDEDFTLLLSSPSVATGSGKVPVLRRSVGAAKILNDDTASHCVKVDPSGTYLRVGASDPAKQATSVDLAKLGIVAGSYVGFLRCGAFQSQPGSSDSNTSMLGVFSDGRRLLARAQFSQPSLGGTVTLHDIAQDFAVGDKTNTPVVRVPTSADRLLISPHVNALDSRIGDNADPNEDFGVFPLFANVDKPSGWPTSLPKSKHHQPEAELLPSDGELEQLMKRIPPADQLPDCQLTDAPGSGRLGIVASPPVPQPQLRGWYDIKNGRANKWEPQQSLYRDLRKTHDGVDIFAPQGTPLLAAITGRLTVWEGFNDTGYGDKMLFLSCKIVAREIHILYAHAEDILVKLEPAGILRVGDERKWRMKDGGVVQIGDSIARSGCRGNAAKVYCGRWLPPYGGRTDHVHVGVYEGNVRKGGLRRFSKDPLKSLGWSPAYAP